MMLSQSSLLLIAAPATPAVCVAQHNITVMVPEGFSKHGDKHLFCESTKWYHVLLFFVANYLSHAATVKARPGQSTAQTIMDFVGALFLPYSGLMRAVEMIMKSSKPGTSDLHKAANAGALCMVVKPASESKRHREHRHKVARYLGTTPSIPESFHMNDKISGNQSPQNDLLSKPVPVEQHQGVTDALETHPVSETNDTGVDNDQAFNITAARFVRNLLFILSTTSPQARKIHGRCELLKGYLLATVPSNAVFDEQYGSMSTDIKITGAYNGVKAAVAIGQTIFASITLYRACGNQIKNTATLLTVLQFCHS